MSRSGRKLPCFMRWSHHPQNPENTDFSPVVRRKILIVLFVNQCYITNDLTLVNKGFLEPEYAHRQRDNS